MSPRWKPLRRILRPDVGTEIDEELRFHLEARIAEYETRGYSRADAERPARERFGDAADLLPAIRRELRRLDPALPVGAPRTMEQMVSSSLAGRRLPMLLTGAFALLTLALGTLVAVGAARLLTGLLCGVSPRDPATYAGAVIVLLLASVGACLVPAWRALRVDPVEVLRVE